jgi:hypothetical protein
MFSGAFDCLHSRQSTVHWAVVIAALTLGEGNDELREIHLGLKPKRRTGPSVGDRLQAAYENVMAKK